MRRRLSLERMPAWPRGLSLEEAAAYVGVSPGTFAAEVEEGRFPKPLRRGPKGGRLTWDKAAIDRRLDVLSGLSPESPDYPDLGDLNWGKSA